MASPEQLDDVQRKLIETALRLLESLDDEKLDTVPFHQQITALYRIFDLYFKLQKAAPRGEQVIHVEFQNPDGSFHPSPPWAGEDPEEQTAL